MAGHDEQPGGDLPRAGVLIRRDGSQVRLRFVQDPDDPTRFEGVDADTGGQVVAGYGARLVMIGGVFYPGQRVARVTCEDS